MANRKLGECGCGGEVYSDGRGRWCTGCETDWLPFPIPEDLRAEAEREDEASAGLPAGREGTD